MTLTLDKRAQVSELALSALVERPGGNYRPTDVEHVKRLSERIAREGFRVELGCPNVRDMGDGRFEIVSGHHRIAACRMLGWDEMPCAVVEIQAGADLLADQVAENACRREAPAWSEAEAFGELVAAGWDPEQISERVGRTLPYVRDRLELLQLDHSIRAPMAAKGWVWCRPLYGLPNAVQRELVRMLDDDMTRAAWSALCERAREVEAERAQSQMFDPASFTLAIETWQANVMTPKAEKWTDTDLVGPGEVAKRLGVSRNTVATWRARSDRGELTPPLPRPVAVLDDGRRAPKLPETSESAGMPVWKWGDIAAWFAQRPGKGWRGQK